MPYLQLQDNKPQATLHLILVNVIVYIATLINYEFMVGTFALWPPETPWFRIWQPVTYMFMHGGFMHIFFNMYSLYLFGSAVEQKIGTRRFLVLYFACGLSAAALNLLVLWLRGTAVPTVGASGSIYGLIVAFAMLYPKARMMLLFPPIPMTAKWMAIVFIGIELITGITDTVDGVAHFAHLGGAILGFVLIWVWYRLPGIRSRARLRKMNGYDDFKRGNYDTRNY